MIFEDTLPKFSGGEICGPPKFGGYGFSGIFALKSCAVEVVRPLFSSEFSKTEIFTIYAVDLTCSCLVKLSAAQNVLKT